MVASLLFFEYYPHREVVAESADVTSSVEGPLGVSPFWAVRVEKKIGGKDAVIAPELPASMLEPGAVE